MGLEQVTDEDSWLTAKKAIENADETSMVAVVVRRQMWLIQM